MMYDMTKKYFHQLLDGLHLVLVVDVHEGADEEKNLEKVVLQLEKCYRRMHKNVKGIAQLLLPKKNLSFNR